MDFINEPPPHLSPVLKTLTCDAGHLEKASRQLSLLIGHSLTINENLNLTAVRQADDFWVRHIEDALLAAEILQKSPGLVIGQAAILDVGAGGGIPGLVWSILWPRASVGLLEGRGKKARFLEETASLLDLNNVNVLYGRAEDLARDAGQRDAWDVVTARALAPMPVLAELTLGFVKPGGWLAVIKGQPFSDEFEQARRGIDEMGGDSGNTRLEPYERSDGKNCLLCLIPKLRATPELYPRRAGTPERKPL